MRTSKTLLLVRFVFIAIAVIFPTKRFTVEYDSSQGKLNHVVFFFLTTIETIKISVTGNC